MSKREWSNGQDELPNIEVSKAEPPDSDQPNTKAPMTNEIFLKRKFEGPSSFHILDDRAKHLVEDCFARVFEVFPFVQPDFLRSKIQEAVRCKGSKVDEDIEHILNLLSESGGKFPSPARVLNQLPSQSDVSKMSSKCPVPQVMLHSTLKAPNFNESTDAEVIITSTYGKFQSSRQTSSDCQMSLSSRLEPSMDQSTRHIMQSLEQPLDLHTQTHLNLKVKHVASGQTHSPSNTALKSLDIPINGPSPRHTRSGLHLGQVPSSLSRSSQPPSLNLEPDFDANNNNSSFNRNFETPSSPKGKGLIKKSAPPAEMAEQISPSRITRKVLLDIPPDIEARLAEEKPFLNKNEEMLNQKKVSTAFSELFVGFYKRDLDAILKKFNGQFSSAAVGLASALLLQKKDLARLMLARMSLHQAKYRMEQESNSSFVLEISLPDGPCQMTMHTLKLWRPYLGTVHLELKESIVAVHDWLDRMLQVRNNYAEPMPGTSSHADFLEKLEQDDSNEQAEEGPSASISPEPEPSSPPEDPGCECQCCFGDFPLHGMIQCFEGHLFCSDCINQYVNSIVGGGLNANLTCISGESCYEGFPRGQLEVMVDLKVLAALEERAMEESIRMAVVGDAECLIQCPHCIYKVFMPDQSDQVLLCQNPVCMKQTCRFCQEEWNDDHIGVSCEDLEKKDEAKIRKKAEEEMTKALLRICNSCQTPLLKSEGCNKMTCRCGAKMCYICRAPIQEYSHFCQHMRVPGRGCEAMQGLSCGKCSLWSNPEEDDRRAMEEIRLKAEKEKEAMGFGNSRKIATVIEPVQPAQAQTAQAQQVQPAQAHNQPAPVQQLRPRELDQHLQELQGITQYLRQQDQMRKIRQIRPNTEQNHYQDHNHYFHYIMNVERFLEYIQQQPLDHQVDAVPPMKYLVVVMRHIRQQVNSGSSIRLLPSQLIRHQTPEQFERIIWTRPQLLQARPNHDLFLQMQQGQNFWYRQQIN